MLPNRSAGEYFVQASQLNIRKGPSTDFDTIGTVEYGTQVKIVDASNPEWYKVSISLSEYQVEETEKLSIFRKDGNKFNVNNTQVNGGQLAGGNEYYLRSSYLNGAQVDMPIQVPQQGNNPFVYGLLFFDETIEKLLEGEIWSQMEPELRALGFDTVDVVPVNRNTYEEDFKNNKFHAVESASGQFAKINDQNAKMDVFAKNVINGEADYEGIIIVNKESGITSLDHLRGKTALTGKQFSESSYQYQKNYLANMVGINIEKDMNLVIDNYHQVIFYEVAKGNADIGFCGDFVMEDSYSKMKDSLAKSKIVLKSEEELDKLRDSVFILPMRGADPIPNNPHALSKNLSGDQVFVDKLFGCIQKIYGNNKEDYDITKATTREYDVLVNME